MSELDRDLLLMLGGMKSSIEDMQKKITGIDAKTDTVIKTSIETQSATKSAHKRIDDIEPVLKEHEAYKNKGLGIMAFIGILFGTFGMVISWLLTKMGVIHP